MSRLDDPTRSGSRSIGVDTCRGKDVVESLTLRINRIGWDLAEIASLEPVLLIFVPAPCIIDGIASCAILEKIEVGCRYWPMTILLRWMVGRTKSAVRV